MEFITYVAIVVRHAAMKWWGWVWGNFGASAILGLILFAIGALLYPYVIAIHPPLKEHLEGPMSSFINLMFGAGTVLALALLMFVFWLIMAPKELYYGQLKLIGDAVLDANEALSEKDEVIASQRPNLVGQIMTRLITPVGGIAPNMRDTMVLLYIIIRNTGEPSIASSWKLRAESADGKRYSLAPRIFTPEFQEDFLRVYPQHGDRVFDPERQIVKAANQPIAKGGAASGYIAFVFEGITYDQFKLANIKMQVVFRDVFDILHTLPDFTDGYLLPKDGILRMFGDC